MNIFDSSKKQPIQTNWLGRTEDRSPGKVKPVTKGGEYFQANPQRSLSYNFGKMSVMPEKLSLNKPGDQHEQQANAMADRVMHLPGKRYTNKNASQNITPVIQPGNSATTSVNAEVNDKILATQGRGRSIDNDIQNSMADQFGENLNQVKVHTDNEAAEMSEALHAKAFTVGKDIYFNSGQFDPGAEKGKHLLAHELTHTVQQQGKNMQVQKEDKHDPTNVPKPEVDFKLLPPDFKFRIHHLIFEANTSKVQLDYKTLGLRTGLSYKYKDALTLDLQKGGTTASAGWVPGKNDFQLGLKQGDFGANLSAAPGQQKCGLKLHYGDNLLPTQGDMSKTFMAGGNAAGSMLSTAPQAFNDPIAYYQAHKSDIDDISKSVDLVKDITDSGKRKIGFGADLSITYDPQSKLVITGAVGINF